MIQRLVIGTTAMRTYVPDVKPKDLDVFSPAPEDWVDTFWHPLLEEWIPPGTNRMATLDELYTVKLSHSGFDIRGVDWEKHTTHAMMLKNVGAELDHVLYQLLCKVWAEVHGRKKVNLQQDKPEFFSDAVRRVYDHDSIHYSVAYEPGRPMYEKVHAEGATVAMDMAAIKALPFDQKVRLYREEIYATALERWVIPSDYTVSPGLAYKRALKKTIVSLTKGWSTRFILDNLEVFLRPDMDYVRHHKANRKYLEVLA